jgi:pimeloyl-ACP methyl ester carboxylesterase
MARPGLTHVSVGSAELAVRLAGDPAHSALLLVHGFPASSRSFRKVIPQLARDHYVIAPDLPGFGDSAPIAQPSFLRFAELLEGLLRQLKVSAIHLYLHDFGAAAALHLATRTPERVRSLIIQNANAHASGMGPTWSATRAFWAHPTPAHEAAATAHLTAEGVRDQYIGGIPADLIAHLDARQWREDWRIMSLPGRLDTQRALVLDYGQHVARFPEIAAYLKQYQPPALLLWGRHDIFFALEETVSWMEALPRMESHILDGPHFLLETHASACARLMAAFLKRIDGRPGPGRRFDHPSASRIR